jgi:hypothetical protein
MEELRRDAREKQENGSSMSELSRILHDFDLVGITLSRPKTSSGVNCITHLPRLPELRSPGMAE